MEKQRLSRQKSLQQIQMSLALKIRYFSLDSCIFPTVHLISEFKKKRYNQLMKNLNHRNTGTHQNTETHMYLPERTINEGVCGVEGVVCGMGGIVEEDRGKREEKREKGNENGEPQTNYNTIPVSRVTKHVEQNRI